MRHSLGKQGVWIIAAAVLVFSTASRELWATPESRSAPEEAPAAALEPAGTTLEDADAALEPAGTTLEDADAAMSRIDYQRARRLAWEAITRGGLSRGELIRAYRIYCLASAQLGLVQDAERGFIRLLALAPDAQLDRRLAPRRRNPLLQARGFWATHRGRFDAQLVVDDPRRRILVRTNDVLGWMAQVVLWHRAHAGAEYVREQRPVASEVVFDLTAWSDASVAAYAEVLDSHGNVLLQLGDPELPYRLAASPSTPSSRSEPEPVLSYLGQFASSASVNGYVALDAKSVGDDVFTFDIHRAALYFQARLLPEVTVEAGLEVEHLGSRDASWYAPHAFIDIAPSSWFKLRAGLFPAPIGVYNTRLHPDFRRVTGHDASFAREVIPVLWSEVGVQLHGEVDLSADTQLDYAVFLSNGLEDSSDQAIHADPATVSLRDLRFNGLDRFQSNKALGGRLGFQHREFEWGVSGYTGRYSVAARHYLTILDADFTYQKEAITLRAEGALSLQPTTTRSLRRRGAYALAAWRVSSHLEPYLQYDFVRLQDWQQRLLVGAAWYPFPHRESTRTLRLKTEAGLEFEPHASAHPVWLLQLTSGF